MKWNWWRKYVLNIDTLIAIFVAILVLYSILTSKRRKYQFDISEGSGFGRILDNRKSPNLSRNRRKRKLNKHEEECRRIFQDIFGVRFRSVRPKWLKNPVTKKNLELDGYNPSISTSKGNGLAFEYDGRQHSKYTPHFHQAGPDEFEYQVVKDTWKDQKCKERGVMLIRVPHFVAFQDIERYIKMMLKRNGVETHIGNMRGLYDRYKNSTPNEVYRNFNKTGSNVYG